ncbi:IPIL1 protein, partial [Thinocorus orbignyianus]|nr:IPIL1 protein [Thinocorus orbignyianus]
EESKEDSDDKGCLDRIFTEPIRRALQSGAHKHGVVEELVNNLFSVFQARLSDRLFLVLQPAIRVGSPFEGWSPCGDDAVYCLLVPLKPPRGHALHLERDTAGELLAKNRVHVVLECTCTRDQRVQNMLCLVHEAEQALKTNRDSSLLSTLCTDSYLDVQKIGSWFQDLVCSAWEVMPQSHCYSMEVLPSHRSCKLQLTNASGGSFLVEMLFGVQQGDSDVFLSSQVTEGIFTPNTVWTESYAVAEAKFFKHMAKQAPHDTFHLKCLQLCASILKGTGFDTYIMKTVVMHLLNTTPPASWRRKLLQLQDIMWSLRSSLEEKCLNHFFLGNGDMPRDIILPPALQAAEPLNLLQCLERDPAAHASALHEFEEL